MTPIARRSVVMLATLLGVLAACSSPTAPPAAATSNSAVIGAPAVPGAGAMCGVTVGSDSHC
jgi:hypothetical protein